MLKYDVKDRIGSYALYCLLKEIYLHFNHMINAGALSRSHFEVIQKYQFLVEYRYSDNIGEIQGLNAL